MYDINGLNLTQPFTKTLLSLRYQERHIMRPSVHYRQMGYFYF